MHTPEAAWQLLQQRLDPLPAERVERPAAVGRVLAQELVATVDVPANHTSAMDGFALDEAAAAVAQRGKALAVSGLSAAGEAPGAEMAPGTAHRIMTGAPLPQGADRIVQIEHTQTLAATSDANKTTGQADEAQPGSAPDQIKVDPLPAPGLHIRRHGEVAKRGRPILAPGTLITPATLGLLATHGISELQVVGKPTLAFLTTGNEVVPPEETPKPGQLRDSHSDFFLAAAAQLGLEALGLGIARDSRQELRSKVEEGLRSRVLILSGGVSMGDFDFVEAALVEHGCEVLFDAIAIQPGKPMVAAQHPGGWVFALPGNPASAMVTFWLLVRPALRRLMGHADSYWREALVATLEGELPAAKGRDRFLPATVRFSQGRLLATPLLPMGSHDVAAYAHGTALVRVPAGSSATHSGDPCELLPLVEWPPDVLAR